jgi:hypothetical protein
VFSVDVSLVVKDASTSAFLIALAHAWGSFSPSLSHVGIEKNMASPSRRFPSLKSTLAARMAQQPDRLNEHAKLAAPSAVTPKLEADAVSISLPAIIEKVQLTTEKLEPNETPNATPHPRQQSRRPSVSLGLITSFGAIFIAGLLSGFAIYSATKPPSVTAPPTSQAELVWLSLLSPGAISPAGQDSNGVTSDQAFQIADAKLHGVRGQENPSEARYWLRVGISRALGDERLRWALTQLGTLYAHPMASPSDFAVARAVWELAAAKDDPVALCFLAQLEEGEHGSPSDKAVALTLFQHAKETGQCVGAEQAIERLSRRTKNE